MYCYIDKSKIHKKKLQYLRKNYKKLSKDDWRNLIEENTEFFKNIKILREFKDYLDWNLIQCLVFEDEIEENVVEEFEKYLDFDYIFKWNLDIKDMKVSKKGENFLIKYKKKFDEQVVDTYDIFFYFNTFDPEFIRKEFPELEKYI